MKKLKQIFRSKAVRMGNLIFMMFLFAAGFMWLPGSQAASGVVEGAKQFVPFSLFSDPKYTPLEIGALLTVLAIAIAGLLYALLLVKQVTAASSGTKRCRKLLQLFVKVQMLIYRLNSQKLVRSSLSSQFCFFITYQGSENAFRWGRSGAFFNRFDFQLVSWFLRNASCHNRKSKSCNCS